MPSLILLNGAPGVGKSTLARRLVDDRPLALLVEIDRLRTELGQWADHSAAAKPLARRLGVALATEQLRAGHDVVVPQLLGRTDFIETLASTAAHVGARFVEVLLRVAPEVGERRFLARRAALRSTGQRHPEHEIADEAVSDALSSTVASLDAVVAARPATVVVDASGDADETYRRLVAALV